MVHRTRASITGLALALVLTLVALAGCAQSAAGPYQLEYQLQGGIAGFDSKLTLDQKGDYSLSERNRPAVTGTISAAELDSLNAYLAKVDWKSLQARYDAGSQVRDDLYYTISLTQGGSTHRVAAAGTAQVPQALKDLMAFLEAERQAHASTAPGSSSGNGGGGGGGANPPATGPGPVPPGPNLSLRHEQNGYVAEAVNEDKALYWQAPGQPRQRVIGLSELPAEFTPQGADPKEIRFGVGADRFTAVALSPDGRRVAFATMGTHGFLAIAVGPGQAPSGSGAPGSALTPLDLGFETSFKGLLWSPDGRYLAAVADVPSGATVTYLYDTGSEGRRILLWQTVQAALGDDREFGYSWTPAYWDSDHVLRLQVSEGPGGKFDPAKLGQWTVDLSTGAMVQVVGAH